MGCGEMLRIVSPGRRLIVTLAAVIALLGATPRSGARGVYQAVVRRTLNAGVPSYKRMKSAAEPQTAQRIGLPTIRAACPHFGRWLTRLEQLGTRAK